MKCKGWLLILLSGIFYNANTYAQFRKYSNEFLNIGAGARGLGMGSTQVASADDATAGYWNPAGLVSVTDNPSLSLMHADYFAGIGKYDYLAAAFPLKQGNQTFGVSMLRFGVDDIPNTLFLVQPDGSINYNNIQSFSSADYAFLVSYAKMIKSDDNMQFSWGGNAKIIYRKVGSFANAWGFGIDLGLMYRAEKWRFGLAARDVTTTFNAWSFSFTDEEKQVLYLTDNDIPVKSSEITAPRLVLGAGYDFAFSEKFHVLAQTDMDVTFDGKRNTVISSNPISIDPKIGVEANINNTVFIRAGASNFQQALADGDTLNQKKVWIFQPSIGAGFKIGNVVIDYAFTNLANQSNPLYTHVFSLRIDLVPKNKESSSSKKVYLPSLPKAEKPKTNKVYIPHS
ncbi:MAG TPA: PorV/PorQ family protein [Chitinophagaceae bacterium]|nr:PorV/PorQ family protein [Chitinophagaceae bacterium]